MFSPNLSKKEAVSGYFGWWLFWIFVQFIVLHRLGWTWQISLSDSVVSNLLLALAGYITQNTYRFYRPGSDKRIQRFSYSIALTFAYMFCLQWILAHLFAGNKNYLKFLEDSLSIRYTFSLLMIALITVTNWLWFFMKEQEENKKRTLETEKLVRDAELTALHQQLQPHFLFNSLNSISALVVTQPAEARKMVQQLSDFLRGTLKKDELQLVKLSDELQHLNLYLEIEKVRFGHRLTTNVEVDEVSLNMYLPSLLLQPLLENAIKFGLYDTIEDVTIGIHTKNENNCLIIQIRNPYDAETASPKKGIGFGLKSVQRRLYLIYARQDLLSYEQKENTFTSTLLIPQIV